MSAAIIFLIGAPFAFAFCALIALEERFDLTGHIIANSARVRDLVDRINDILDA